MADADNPELSEAHFEIGAEGDMVVSEATLDMGGGDDFSPQHHHHHDTPHGTPYDAGADTVAHYDQIGAPVGQFDAQPQYQTEAPVFQYPAEAQDDHTGVPVSQYEAQPQYQTEAQLIQQPEYPPEAQMGQYYPSHKHQPQGHIGAPEPPQHRVRGARRAAQGDSRGRRVDDGHGPQRTREDHVANEAQIKASQTVAAMNLPAELLDRYRRKFNALDLDKDGIVTLREFASVSKVFGYNLSREEIQDIFGRRDLDVSGGITFDEFVVAMRNRAGQHSNIDNVRAKFRTYDRKNRGYITADEAHPILEKELGFDENKSEALVDMYDKNRDYRLSLFEFVDFQNRVEQLKQQIVSAFAQFDTNRDGFVDLSEAKAVMIPRGCTEAQVEALVNKADRDHDGRLNYSEFATFWDIPLN